MPVAKRTMNGRGRRLLLIDDVETGFVRGTVSIAWAMPVPGPWGNLGLDQARRNSLPVCVQWPGDIERPFWVFGALDEPAREPDPRTTISMEPRRPEPRPEPLCWPPSPASKLGLHDTAAGFQDLHAWRRWANRTISMRSSLALILAMMGSSPTRYRQRLR